MFNGWDAAKSQDKKRAWLDAVGKRWRVWTREVVELHLSFPGDVAQAMKRRTVRRNHSLVGVREVERGRR